MIFLVFQSIVNLPGYNMEYVIITLSTSITLTIKTKETANLASSASQSQFHKETSPVMTNLKGKDTDFLQFISSPVVSIMRANEKNGPIISFNTFFVSPLMIIAATVT